MAGNECSSTGCGYSAGMAIAVMSPGGILTFGLLLVVLLAAFSWSYDGLGPGCHLYPTSYKEVPLIRVPCPPLRTVLPVLPEPGAVLPSAFNVTIRSDRRGTCRGTHLVHACVGYCESSAFPSRYSVLVASNFTHNITSASRCCTISKDTKVKVRLDCPRGRHHDDIEILTARACRCDMCRKARY
ncbi:glycoprotein hormone alpha-2-like [Scleropages formosus]|uniref:Glycoprotein hormones alpha chain n=1 Tax=Scleropages formosus TaxID=113540 RepID=A0A0P7TUF9_SCLFO|nr:glycoprotein hormone alpha-2-like [Scleropages formosus]